MTKRSRRDLANLLLTGVAVFAGCLGVFLWQDWRRVHDREWRSAHLRAEVVCSELARGIAEGRLAHPVGGVVVVVPSELGDRLGRMPTRVSASDRETLGALLPVVFPTRRWTSLQFSLTTFSDQEASGWSVVVRQRLTDGRIREFRSDPRVESCAASTTVAQGG